jgi:hypothetical protein
VTTQPILWRCLFQPGMEHFQLRSVPTGWQLAGTVVAVRDNQPLLVTYAVDCSSNWQTQNVELVVTRSGEERSLSLRADSDRNWFLDGQEIAEVAGCVDIDLGITPSTNTLPIRRLNLAVGEGADVLATWVQFPSLEIRTLSQRYTRLAERVYRYESDTGFTAELEVDDAGVVTTYPGGWERVG